MNAFFIAGVQRSGTTLLSVLLGRHPEIDIDGNALAFRITTCFGLYERVLPYNLEHEPAPLLSWLIEQDYKGRLAAFLDYENMQPGTSARELVANGIEQRLAERGKTVFGDKAPDIEHFAEKLLLLVPEAKIIHVVRDGRAAAYSKASRAHRNLCLAGQEWVESNVAGLHNQAMIGETQYLMVRYEDILMQPEATLTRVCTFLGLEFTRAMLEPDQQEDATTAYVKSGLDASKIHAWRLKLSAVQIRKLEAVQGPMLERFGYELENPELVKQHQPMSMSRRIWLAQRSNFRQLFVSKRQGMTNRETVAVNVPLRTRINHFVFYFWYEFMPKKLFQRTFRKRWIKDVKLKR